MVSWRLFECNDEKLTESSESAEKALKAMRSFGRGGQDNNAVQRGNP